MARRSSAGADTVKCNPREWKIAVYIRLSKEDARDFGESESVSNQRAIIHEYIAGLDDGDKYKIVEEYVDDGLTGTDDNRPEFQRMIRDMETGRVNCVVSKNLSRMFRNYSDQGNFLEKILPMNRTRFITVSEPRVDSYLRPETIIGLEIPINGLMNDRYAAKTSQDVRDTFATKRRKGEFIGAFAPYGYAKDPFNKNHLIVDKEAAPIIRRIFKWFVQDGMSKVGIAKRLNEEGVLNPSAYKRSKGFKYNNPQIHINDGYWSPRTIDAILRNQMYAGTMVQGRQTVVNYKVHDKVPVPEKEWYIVENTHEAIVDRRIFGKAQGLQRRETRTPPNEKQLCLFSGFVRCADCLKAMTRQKSRNCVYYYCRTYRDKSKCTKHTVREDLLKEAVLRTIQWQIALVASPSGVAAAIGEAPPMKAKTENPTAVLEDRQRDLDRITDIVDSLYGDWKTGEISREEYLRMKKKYEAQAIKLKLMIETFRKECEQMDRADGKGNPDLESFLHCNNIISLTRGVLVDLVKNIYIHKGGEIEIEFLFADQYKRILENVCI